MTPPDVRAEIARRRHALDEQFRVTLDEIASLQIAMAMEISCTRDFKSGLRERLEVAADVVAKVRRKVHKHQRHKDRNEDQMDDWKLQQRRASQADAARQTGERW